MTEHTSNTGPFLIIMKCGHWRDAAERPTGTDHPCGRSQECTLPNLERRPRRIVRIVPAARTGLAGGDVNGLADAILAGAERGYFPEGMARLRAALREVISDGISDDEVERRLADVVDRAAAGDPGRREILAGPNGSAEDGCAVKPVSPTSTGGATSTKEISFVDNGHSVFANVAGAIQGAAWGPAADGSGEWFVLVAGERSARRVAGKDAGVAELRERIGSAP